LYLTARFTRGWNPVRLTDRHATTVHSDHGRPIKVHIHAKDSATNPHYCIFCLYLNAFAAAENILNVRPSFSKEEGNANVPFRLARIVFSLLQADVTFFIETYNAPVRKLEFQPPTFHGHDPLASLHESSEGESCPRSLI
jgi:hypothetical protein